MMKKWVQLVKNEGHLLYIEMKWNEAEIVQNKEMKLIRGVKLFAAELFGYF